MTIMEITTDTNRAMGMTGTEATAITTDNGRNAEDQEARGFYHDSTNKRAISGLISLASLCSADVLQEPSHPETDPKPFYGSRVS